ncbi:MAG TPA: SDR family oxidoreductase [Myxococcaceae bacterium]|jgi:uncharacterized protein YbjT (DUF2867 family)
MILVTGATGTVGSEVVRQLRAAGQKVRAMVRSPDKVEAIKKQGAEVALGDFGRPETHREALAGVEKVFLLSAMTPKMAEHETAFVNSAKDAGVKHVVLLSTIGAAFEPGLKLGKLHRAGELALEASGMAWTFLRPNSFMTNYFGNVGSVKGQGMVYSCTGKFQFAPIDPRDVAAVAVKALTSPGHEGKAYYLTGPELVTDASMTQKMAAAIGKAIQVVDVPVEAARQAMVGMGFGEWLAAALCEFYSPGVVEQAARLSNDAQAVLGRPPRSFEEWAKEFGGAFR